MLGKYMKHEFKETGKLMIPLNLVILVFTLLGMVMLGSRLLSTPAMALIGIASLTLYILTLFAIFIVVYVYFTVRFYKTMYQSQGYLTHTLPLSTGSIVNTKVFVSLFWVTVTVVFTTLSIIALVYTAMGQEWGKMAVDSDISFLKELLFSFLLPCFSLTILGGLEQLLMIYASLAIGQLFRQYRVLASIGTFFVFYIALQILGTLTMFFTQFFSMDRLFHISENISGDSFIPFYRQLFSVSTIEVIVFCIVFYILCYWLTDKKLNLE